MKKIIVLIFVSLLPFSIVHADYKLTNGFKRDAVKAAPKVVANYGWMIRSAADEFSISAIELTTRIVVESLGNPNAVSSSNAIGLTGIKARTALADVRRLYPTVRFSNDLKDPYNNVRIAAAYIAALRDHYGFEDIANRSVAYFEGPTKARKMNEKAIYSHFYPQKMDWVRALPQIPVLIN